LAIFSRSASAGLGDLGLGGGALGAEPDFGDLEDRQLLAMALLDAAASLGPVLERDGLDAAILAQDAALTAASATMG
jgi:hypothetical protein